MPFDAHSNFAVSRVVTAPSPGLSGTTLTVSTGEGALFPAVPFNATVWPQGQTATSTNAEIVRVTNITGDDFTITRAQESTSAKDIRSNYQIANTITVKVIEDIETAISNIISAGGGGVSVISAELASVDARVTSADLHASTASAAATSVDARVNTVSNLVSALTSAHNALSNVVSAGGAAASVTSAEHASVDAKVSVLSDRVVSIAAQTTSLEVHASAASAAATSADAHAAVASAAATSVDNRATSIETRLSTLSDKVVSVSAQLVSLETHASAASAAATSILNFVQGVSTRSALSAGVSTQGLQSALNALSNRISLNAKAISDIISAGGGGTSVTSNELSAASAQAASALSAHAVAGHYVTLQNVDASAVSAGMAVYAFTSADTFKRADASATGTELVVGLVLEAAINVSATGRVQTQGVISLTSAQWSDVTSVGTGLTPGDIYYLHSTPGRLTTALLSAPAVRHIVGQAIAPNRLQLMLTPFDDDTSAINDLSARIASLENVSAVGPTASAVVGLQSALNALSNRISAGGGAGSVTSAEHTSVDSRVNSVNSFISGISSRSVGDVSTHGFQSVVNALSNRVSVTAALLSNAISAGSATASAICALLSAVSARSALSATVSTHGLQSVVDALSNRISLNAKAISDIISAGGGGVSVTSNELSAASAQAASAIQVASAAATSADGHANTASAAATSVNSRVNSVNTALSALSARSVGDVSTHGLQSVLDALSGRISAVAGGSVTSNEASAISHTASVANQSIVNVLSSLTVRTSIGGATSVKGIQSALNALSNQTSDLETSLRQTSADLEAHVVAASAAATSADGHAATASAAATSVDSRVASISAAHASLSVRSVGDVSTHGFQSMLNALSNRISAGGGTGSVTSTEASAISHNASVNNQSIVNMLSALTVRTSVGGATSIKGIQSALDALSNQASDLATSLRQTSADLETHVVAASAAATSVDGRVTSANVLIANVDNRTSIVESAVVSINALLASVSARSAISATVSTHGLQSIFDALSNRISIHAKQISDIISAGGGGVSVTSNEASAISHNASVNNQSIVAFISGVSAMSGATADVSTHGLQSVINALSNRISINAALISNAISAGSATASTISERITSVFGRIAVLANDTNVSAGTLTTIAGLSLALSTGAIYQMEAMVAYTTSAGQVLGFGLNFGGMTHAAGYIRHTNIGQDAAQSITSTVHAAFDETGGGSIVMSIYASVAGGTGTKHVKYDGLFVVSTSAPDPMHLLTKASSGTGQVVCKKGSYLRLYKIG